MTTTTTNPADLARRAVACSGWRWLPGALARRETGPCSGSYRYTDADVRAGTVYVGGTPDLTDPATLGALLHLVREAWGEHATTMASVYEAPEHRWEVFSGRVGTPDYGHRIAVGATEPEALVAALEVAPGVR